MSFLTSTRSGHVQFVVVIVGITGGIGKEIAATFLKDYKPFFPTIIGTTRDKGSEAAKALAAAGADIREVPDDDNEEEALSKVFQGVDVVIDTLGGPAAKTKNLVIKAVAKAGVSVFIPSEFGIDHRINDFPGYEHEEWITKAERDRVARELLQGKTKVISLYTSAFLEYIGPFFGFDTANQEFTVVGSRTQRITFTSTSDIARAVAELALLALSPTHASTVPDYVRIAGTTRSVVEIKEIVEKVRKEVGIKDAKPFEIVEEDLASFVGRLKEKMKNDKELNISDHLKIVIGQGKADFSENDNELVNRNGKVWKWKSMEDHVRAVGGKFGE